MEALTGIRALPTTNRAESTPICQSKALVLTSVPTVHDQRPRNATAKDRRCLRNPRNAGFPEE